jgi:LCP family protein required for cell wall assembly
MVRKMFILKFKRKYEREEIVIPLNNPYEQRSSRSRRRSGCLKWLVLAGGALVGLIIMCSGLTLGYVLLPPPPMDILVVGMDSRGNEGAVARTDSIMVININADTVKVSVLSIPRGLFVNVPRYGSQMINTANFLGEVDEAGTGMTLLSQTIQQNFGIEIDGYIRMDFSGFEAMIDAVGGVDIDVPYVVEDYAYPTHDYGTVQIRFETGWQRMDGERSLIYARTRHGDDDYRRAERQQQVLSAFVSRSINPLAWGNLLVALNQSVETNLSLSDMMMIAPTAFVSNGKFNQLVINRDYILAGTNGPIPDYDKIASYISENFD